MVPIILNTTTIKEGFRGVMKDLATSPEDRQISDDFDKFLLDWLRWVIPIGYLKQHLTVGEQLGASIFLVNIYNLIVYHKISTKT